MNFVRNPQLLTKGLREVIQRDSIILIGILFPFAGLLDTIWEPRLTSQEKSTIYVIIFFLTTLSLLRLRAGSVLDRKPYIAVITYVILLLPATGYFVDFRSLYIFGWIVPLFIAHFYYGNRLYYPVVGALLINQLIKSFIHGDFTPPTGEDYVYFVAEFFIILGVTRLIIDAQRVSAEDRKVLLASLQKAEFEEKRVSELVNSLSDAVLAVNTEGTITKHNATALNLLDTHEDIDSEPIESLLQLENDSSEPIAISRLLVHASRSYTTKSYTLLLKNGNRLAVSLSIIPIKTSGTQSMSGYLIVLRDITKEKTLEQEQKTFMSLLSHELRTPVTISEGSLSNIELVAKASDAHTSLVPSITDAHNQIVALGQRLNKMDAFITASQPLKKEAMESVTLHDLITKLLDKYTEALQAKNIAIEREGSTAIALVTSQDRLQAILDELITNAIKYTAEGKITIRIAQDEAQTTISVADTGKGIAPEKISTLFRPFHQTEDFETRSDVGAGLGLYIAQEMAQSIHAQISVEATVGKGSTFTLTIQR